jgi:hypothetical protein
MKPFNELMLNRCRSKRSKSPIVLSKYTNPERHLTEWRSASVDEYGAIRSGSETAQYSGGKQTSSRVANHEYLFVAFKARSHQVRIQDGHKKSFGVRTNGEPVEFGLEEKFQRIDRPEDKNRRPIPGIPPI